MLDAEARIRRFQDAIGAGVDPAALVDPLNRAQAERAAAHTEIDNAPARTTLTNAEVYAMIDSLGDVGAALRNAEPISLHQLYRRLDLSMRFEPAEQAIHVTARPRVDNACVRGGNCTLSTRIGLGGNAARMAAYEALATAHKAERGGRAAARSSVGRPASM